MTLTGGSISPNTPLDISNWDTTAKSSSWHLEICALQRPLILPKSTSRKANFSRKSNFSMGLIRIKLDKLFCCIYPLVLNVSPNFLLIIACAESSSYTSLTTNLLGRLVRVICIPSNSKSTRHDVLPYACNLLPSPKRAKNIPRRIEVLPTPEGPDNNAIP